MPKKKKLKKKTKAKSAEKKPAKNKRFKAKKKSEALLLLQDGSIFRGRAIGANTTELGELVFHTSYTGYQEILTDPSYRKQILVFASAHIGNQGYHPEDWESSNIWASGCVMRNYSETTEHWRRESSLENTLLAKNIAGLVGVDTRRLILKIRDEGNSWGVISTDGRSVAELMEILETAPKMEGLSLVKEVTARSSYTWVTGSSSLIANPQHQRSRTHRRCVVMDFGVKRQILRYLIDYGFEEVVVVPSFTRAEEVLSLKPELVVLSNGPGDPAAETEIIEEVKKLHGKIPLFGICLGHQILALSLGLKTHKLSFGHHAANHPVMNLRTQRVEISSQNHGFAVKSENAESLGVEITHINMNDQSVAGFVQRDLEIQGIQYHPESSPGPLDSVYLFENLRKSSAA